MQCTLLSEYYILGLSCNKIMISGFCPLLSISRGVVDDMRKAAKAEGWPSLDVYRQVMKLVDWNPQVRIFLSLRFH
jgi:hypothetical protein